ILHLFFPPSAHHRHLHSFPTRRSSDLSACACFGRVTLVRGSVGAPTAHACPGNGSHHPENISAGRGGPRGELSRPHLGPASWCRSEEHTSELQSRGHLVCRLLLEKKKE